MTRGVACCDNYSMLHASTDLDVSVEEDVLTMAKMPYLTLIVKRLIRLDRVGLCH